MADVNWRAQVLGLAQVWGPDGQRLRLERRAAALLAYLGLEGPSPKFPLASLLWPDSPAATVRNNMRQLLRRLRLTSGGGEWVEADAERLALNASLALDAARMKAAALARQHAHVLEALSPEGGSALLAGFDFDDCPELARWLDGARSAVEGWVRKAREAEIERHTAQGNWTAALALAQAWVQHEPESEQAGSHLIRLHYLQGDRGAALTAFERLRSVLARELGVTPMPDTLALVRQIERGTQLPHAPALPRAALPLSVLRPPVLAGREAAWRQLEEGWRTGQMLFISGEPGTGKSRLAEEFANTQGRWGRIEGRAGDQDIPFASEARAFRTQMARWPEVKLPEWVRDELSRILPELGSPRPLLPLDSESSMLRFYDAQVEAIRLLHQHETLSIADDVQYWDKASAKAFTYAISRLSEAGERGAPGPRFMDCYRRGELPPYAQTYIHQLVDEGWARIIELGPLGPEEVRQLLAGLELPGAERHAEALSRYTGGNPLYIVETLKHLIETDALAQDWPSRLPPPGRVGPLIRRRLEHLSPLALQSAQLAALAGAHFKAALVPEVLQVSVSPVHIALAELETAQVLMGERFSHDLVREAVLASLLPAAARTLHGRLATVFENERAPPLVLAHHWLEAGAVERALPHLLAAARSEEQVLPLEQAADHYARAALLMEQAGRTKEAMQARAAEVRCRTRVAPSQG
ncbi:BTAD domain-containing putative transcriptional regulator [Stigmatella sp. ncwal1]|uniref:BTAD domain-containing putative transcriptional regulator n=1 Tax=Stigmatella ashevillensis TaxID=2995309 RepID=A0ABT5DI45_9BACT|nr:BTAD domain-containing putative transcriptional regulator [Stigmatella ashevillena]MDC0712007.1 BTAD domain-containing putative transcriptional regulator [Stigmatella ashevillena]